MTEKSIYDSEKIIPFAQGYSPCDKKGDEILLKYGCPTGFFLTSVKLHGMISTEITSVDAYNSSFYSLLFFYLQQHRKDFIPTSRNDLTT